MADEKAENRFQCLDKSKITQPSDISADFSLNVLSHDYYPTNKPIFNGGSSRKVEGIATEAPLRNGFANGYVRSHPQTKDNSKLEGDEDSERTWKSEWKNFADAIAISGMRFIIDGQLPLIRRIIWTVLVFLGAMLMCYQLVERLAHFYSYPKGTLFEVEYPEPGQMTFPAVTVCNENRIREHKARDLGLWYTYRTMFWPFPYDVSRPDVNFTGLDDFYKTHPKNTVDWRKINIELSNTYESSVLLATYNSQHLSKANTSYVLTDMGNCITFNPEGSWKLGRSGSGYGLQLTLVLNQSDYLVLYGYNAGFRLLVHTPGEYPDTLNKGILLNPGAVSNIEINEIQKTLLGPPYGRCEPGKKLRYMPVYSVDSCMFECLHVYLMQRCGCVFIAFADYARDTSVCDPREETCLGEAFLDYYAQRLSTKCSCPPACSSTSYTYSASYSSLSNLLVNHVIENLIVNASEQEFRSDYTFPNVFFSSASYTKITEEQSYDIFTLFCDMGGALGLLLGSTFLTVYEFVDFFVFTAWSVHRRQRTS